MGTRKEEETEQEVVSAARRKPPEVMRKGIRKLTSLLWKCTKMRLIYDTSFSNRKYD